MRLPRVGGGMLGVCGGGGGDALRDARAMGRPCGTVLIHLRHSRRTFQQRIFGNV